jgi:hypothetical protein
MLVKKRLTRAPTSRDEFSGASILRMAEAAPYVEREGPRPFQPKSPPRAPARSAPHLPPRPAVTRSSATLAVVNSTWSPILINQR